MTTVAADRMTAEPAAELVPASQETTLNVIRGRRWHEPLVGKLIRRVRRSASAGS